MAAGAEVSGETAVLEMDFPVAVLEPSSPEKTTPASGKNTEKNEKSNSEKAGEVDVINGVKASDLNSNADSKSELQMKDFVDMLKKLKLNPLAKDSNITLSSRRHIRPSLSWIMRKNSYNTTRRRMSGRAFRAQRDDSIRRTVYVSDIDHNVVDCRVCDSARAALSPGHCWVLPIKVLPSKTAILPVNPTFLPQQGGTMCASKSTGQTA
ncbi:UNVERIFIED_CONTAM: Polyadenylate-binding protein-interacting protein 8 [Sesamum angustifolium]|uniref:Polyadenylate-binding protein-interacting protein 8 n=1 Tax=Sesamum angustifolium TaxID=2727405 RepID=A0AAW2KWQ5_9LAMI